MKKIALLHYSYPPSMGGVEVIMQEHAHVLAGLGYDVRVLTGSGEEEHPQIQLVTNSRLQSILQQNRKLQARILKEGIMDDTFRQVSQEIRKILDEHLSDRDIIIVHNMATLIHNLPFLQAFKAYASDNPNKKIIIWAHDQTLVDEEKILEKKEGISLSPEQRELLLAPIPGAMYVAISETFKKLLSQIMHIPQDEIVVIPNGINLKRFFPLNDHAWNLIQEQGLLDAYPLLFSPVNILQRKNLLYSLEVISELKKQYPKIKYVISGKPSMHREIAGHYEQLQERVISLGLEDTVIFLNEKIAETIPQQFINIFYSLSDAVFYFSKTENFGIPILEALLLKTPIFLSNLEVFKEIGGDKLQYIDYTTVTPQEAAKKIHTYLSSDKEGIMHALVRSKYNLSTIVATKLIPLFS